MPRLQAASAVGSGRSRGRVSRQAASRRAGTREGEAHMAVDVLDEVPVMNGGVQPPTTRQCGPWHEAKGLADFNTWPMPGKGGRHGIRGICRAGEPIVTAPVGSEQPG